MSHNRIPRRVFAERDQVLARVRQNLAFASYEVDILVAPPFAPETGTAGFAVHADGVIDVLYRAPVRQVCENALVGAS